MDRAPLDVDRIRSAAPAWPDVRVVEETGSTNADLLAIPADGLDRVVLAAEFQAGGRGRLDRIWTSPPRAGLTVSVRFTPPVAPARWGLLPLLAGLALRAAVAEVAGVVTRLKWPNDLLCGPDEGKAAGILAQTAPGPRARAVVGMGLNVTTTRDELPVETATSLALCGARRTDRSDLLIALLAGLDARLSAWPAGDEELVAEYRQHCATLGRDVQVSTTDGASIRARAVDVAADGRLVLDDGRLIGAGDVVHVR